MRSRLITYLIGICGNPSIVDVGGVPYLSPTPKLNHIYNLKHVATEIGNPDAFFIGAGAGSWRLAGVNCEVPSMLLLYS